MNFELVKTGIGLKKAICGALAVATAVTCVQVGVSTISTYFGNNVTSGNVTSGNITSGNVTNGNITSGNVTDGNVTGGNVTDGNVDKKKYTFELSYDGEYYILTGYKGSIRGEIIIPDTYKGKPVKQIGSYAFEYNYAITSVVIPDSVTAIGYGAFEYCSNLRTITIPGSVREISGYVFNGCKSLMAIDVDENNPEYTSVDGVLFNKDKTELIKYPTKKAGAEYVIPDSVETIEYHAFENCQRLTKVIIGNGVTDLYDTFWSCQRLKTVVIGDNVRSIGENEFYACSGLEEIVVSENNLEFSSIEGVLFYKEKTVLRMYPDGKKDIEYTIPDSVTEIGDRAFENNICLQTLNFSENLTAGLGYCSLMNCRSLSAINVDENNPVYSSVDGVLFNKDKTELIKYPSRKKNCAYTIPDSVREIEVNAFIGCEYLESIVIPDNVTIGGGAFGDCDNLVSIVLPDNVSIGGEVFFETAYYNNNDNWDNGGFYVGNHLIEVDRNKRGTYKVKPGTKTIAYGAFAYCEVTSIEIPDGVTSIGESAFEWCTELTSIVIPDSVTNIGKAAFYGCSSLTSIVIPKGVTTIQGSTFAECTNLASVIISAGVTRIEEYAFSNCPGLASITVDKNNPAYTSVDGVLFNKDKTELIKYPAKKSNEEYIIPGSVTSIEESAFINCTALKAVTIPDSVQRIENGAFNGCIALEDITIPDSVTSIGQWAFADCTSLTSITIPGNIKNISGYSFEGCSGLKSVTICDGVKEIGFWTFNYCTSLETVIIPDSVTYIGDSAFGKCTSLKSITIPDSVQRIERDTFTGCTGLEAIIIPDSVTSIDYWAFVGCTSLTSITIPDSVTNIQNDAFRNTGYYNNEANWENGVLYIDNHLIAGNKIDEEISAFVGGVEGDYVIKPGTKTIAAGAFRHCDKLISVTIPDSVVTIGSEAFSNCTSLNFISIPDSVECIEYGVFDNTGYYNNEVNWENGVLYIGNHLIKAQKTLSEKYIIKNRTRTIAGSAFYDCQNLTSITIPDSVVFIGGSAFSGCKRLKSIAIPDGVTKIYDYTFHDAVSLESIEIPGSVTEIGEGAFYNCKNLKSVIIPEGVTTIEWDAFYNCENLESVTIPDSVTSIGTMSLGYYWVSEFDADTRKVAGFKIYGKEGSAAQAYAVENGFEFIAIADEQEEPVQGTENTQIDYDNMVIRTGVQSADDIIEILNVSENATVVAEPSLKYGSVERLGTGSVISVYDGDKHIGDFTLVVEGDTTGDSVCDVLDCATVALVANGLKEFDGAYAMAADSNCDDVVDDADYQAIINKMLA